MRWNFLLLKKDSIATKTCIDRILDKNTPTPMDCARRETGTTSKTRHRHPSIPPAFSAASTEARLLFLVSPFSFPSEPLQPVSLCSPFPCCLQFFVCRFILSCHLFLLFPRCKSRFSGQPHWSPPSLPPWWNRPSSWASWQREPLHTWAAWPPSFLSPLSIWYFYISYLCLSTILK